MRDPSRFPKLDTPAVLSPMASVTDIAFRILAKRYGCGMAYTEFVSSAAVVRGNKSSLKLVRTDPYEKPVGVQLFGHDVQEVVEAAKMVSERFDVVDVNCGCPAWKVIKTGAGSELLKEPAGIGKFVNKLASAIDKPVTVKIRSGVDDKHINAVEVAKVAEDAGAAAVAVHGRTAKQGYSGVADWDLIKQVKDAVNIPVIGNGDVFSAEIFKKRLEESGVDAILIGRGAMGNPDIFAQINSMLKKGEYEVKDRLTQFREYHELALKHEIAFRNIKGHAMDFTKGLTGGAELRLKISQAKDDDELMGLIDNYTSDS